jgi:hypothetical protein
MQRRDLVSTGTTSRCHDPAFLPSISDTDELAGAGKLEHGDRRVEGRQTDDGPAGGAHAKLARLLHQDAVVAKDPARSVGGKRRSGTWCCRCCGEDER